MFCNMFFCPSHLPGRRRCCWVMRKPSHRTQNTFNDMKLRIRGCECFADGAWQLFRVTFRGTEEASQRGFGGWEGGIPLGVWAFDITKGESLIELFHEQNNCSRINLARTPRRGWRIEKPRKIEEWGGQGGGGEHENFTRLFIKKYFLGAYKRRQDRIWGDFWLSSTIHRPEFKKNYTPAGGLLGQERRKNPHWICCAADDNQAKNNCNSFSGTIINPHSSSWTMSAPNLLWLTA